MPSLIQSVEGVNYRRPDAGSPDEFVTEEKETEKLLPPTPSKCPKLMKTSQSWTTHGLGANGLDSDNWDEHTHGEKNWSGAGSQQSLKQTELQEYTTSPVVMSPIQNCKRVLKSISRFWWDQCYPALTFSAWLDSGRRLLEDKHRITEAAWYVLKEFPEEKKTLFDEKVIEDRQNPPLSLFPVTLAIYGLAWNMNPKIILSKVTLFIYGLAWKLASLYLIPDVKNQAAFAHGMEMEDTLACRIHAGWAAKMLQMETAEQQLKLTQGQMFAGATAGAGAMGNSGLQAMAAESGGIMQSAGIIKGSTVQGPGPGALRPVPAMLHHPTFYKHAIPAARGLPRMLPSLLAVIPAGAYLYFTGLSRTRNMLATIVEDGRTEMAEEVKMRYGVF